MTPSTIRKAINSKTSVKLGTRKLLVAMGMSYQPCFNEGSLPPPYRGPLPAPAAGAGRRPANVTDLLLVQREDEQRGESQVHEVHGFNQADRQEHDGEQPALSLGLTGHPGDRLATGQAVTDGCARSEERRVGKECSSR